MISTVIIDDEQNNIDALKILLEQFCPEIMLAGTALNTQTGYSIIRQLQPQLVFLDIEMPFGNGFDLLEKLAPVNFEVIFVTAFDQYAIKAFKYAALDYLLKPVNIDEIRRAIKAVMSRLEEKSVNTRIESLLNNLKNDVSVLRRIALPTADGLVFETTENIVHMKAEKSYTCVFTNDGKKRLASKSLGEFEDLLPPAIFCRVHHSHIINLNFVKKYFRGRGGYVELMDGTTVEVSSRKKDEFLLKFKT